MNLKKVYQYMRLELRIVTFIISMIALIVIFISFIVPSESLEKGNVVLVPHILSQTSKHESCFLCGMTRSFIAMSAGNFAQAKQYNKFGPLLYGLFWITSLWGITISLNSLFGYLVQAAKRDSSLTEEQTRR